MQLTCPPGGLPLPHPYAEQQGLSSLLCSLRPPIEERAGEQKWRLSLLGLIPGDLRGTGLEQWGGSGQWGRAGQKNGWAWATGRMWARGGVWVKAEPLNWPGLGALVGMEMPLASTPKTLGGKDLPRTS